MRRWTVERVLFWLVLALDLALTGVIIYQAQVLERQRYFIRVLYKSLEACEGAD